VAEICRRLEGLPLAIELAAARVGLSAEQLATRLGESLKLLTGGSRTAVPRQQTLRGTLDWSYELLSEPEKTLFRRLSVFAGGWTLAVAEVVGSGEGIEAADVLDLLSGLVDKSLVVADASGKSGGVRYRMLEPIRQYAREKLEVSREAEETLRRHAEFFLALSEEAETRWQGPEESIWLDRLEVEHDNLRMALSWSLEGGDPRTGLRLAAAASWFWELRGHLGESTRWLEKALAKAGVGAPVARAEALRRLGDILTGQGDFEGAEARLEEALAGYKELGERARAATCLASLGWVAEYQGDIARAIALLEESLALARESENLKIVPNILNALGWTAFDDGEFGRAKALWEEALELERQLGSNMVASQVLFNLGYTELARGNQERAIVYLEEGLTIARKLGDKAVVSANLIGLGIAATLKGEPKLAKDLLKEGLAIELELGNRIDIPESLEALAGVAGALGEDLRAARLWGAADALREVIDIACAPADRMLHEPQ